MTDPLLTLGDLRFETTSLVTLAQELHEAVQVGHLDRVPLDRVALLLDTLRGHVGDLHDDVRRLVRVRDAWHH